MILWTKYLDNSQQCKNHVKNYTPKQWKHAVADVWKINFGLTYNSMESYHPENLLVSLQILEKK